MKQHNTSRRSLIVALACVAVWLWPAATMHVQANRIFAGTDLLETLDGTGMIFASDPLPSDFFGPGSDPFEGQIALTGSPLAPPAGSVDTLVERQGEVAFGEPPTNPQTVPIEIVALSLVSVAPIRVTYFGGVTESFFDVSVEPSPPTAPPSGGQLSLNHNAAPPDGGDVNPGPDSFFDVFFDVTFVDTTDPGVVYQMTGSDRFEDHVELQVGVPWAHTVPAPYLHDASGGFFPGTLPGEPGLPPVPMIFASERFVWNLRLAETVPEPGTAALLGLWALAFLGRRRRA